jgi:serine/threonine protein kinase
VVRLAKHRKTERIVAIKCMQKMTIRKNKQIEAVLNECRSNQGMKHPFVNELLGTLQDTRYLYLFMNLIQGGELWGLLYQSRALPRSDTGGLKEKIARFYAAQVACAIAHIHERGYMYRDLKPENLMIGKKGYLRIVDFGFCKKTPPQGKKSMTLCGTPEYLSPELVLQKGHNQGVDWWAFGCLVFELLTSDTPFADNHQGRIFKKIVNAEKLIPYLFSRRFPRKARNLVELLLVPNPNLRLGMGRQGGNGVMKHEWFGGMDWKKLVGMKYKAPYRPRLENETDVVVDLDNEDEEAENSEGNVKEDLEIEFWKDFAVDVSDDDGDSKEDFG